MNLVKFESIFKAYGVAVSLQNRNKLRLFQSMELMSDATSRTPKEKEKVKNVY